MGERPPLSIRLRRLTPEAARFGTVGACGVLANVTVFTMCGQLLGLAPLVAGVLATSAAIVTTYLGNRYWTYAHCAKDPVLQEAGLFTLFSGLGLAIENGVLALSHYGLGLTSPLADNVARNAVGISAASLFRFWSYRTWVFRDTRTRGTHGVRGRRSARNGPATTRAAPEARAGRRLGPLLIRL